MQQPEHDIADPSRELARRIVDGDRTAEAELIRRYERGIRLILLRRTGNPELAKDLCQDTFVIILRKLRAGEINNPGQLAGFVSRTAVNLSIQHFRSEKRHVYLQDGMIDSQLAHYDKKGEKLDRLTIRAMLEKVLNQLTVTRDREILRRYYLSDDDKQVICLNLHISIVHFDRVLYRAKQRMRQLIDKQKGLKALLFGGLLHE